MSLDPTPIHTVHFPAVRPSALAGTWYPGTATALRRTIVDYLDQVTPVSLPGPLLALVSPHAGYAYSGPIAAHSYAQLRLPATHFHSALSGGPTRPAVRRIILCGPLHRAIRRSQIGAFMVPAEDSYRTPLGEVPLDRPWIARLGERVGLTTVQGDEEHSLEIQLPFLQITLERFALVPIMLGEHIDDRGAQSRLEELASALADLADDETLLVASTDLTHLDSYSDVKRIDARLVELVGQFDVDGLAAALRSGEVQACGATGLVAVMRAAQKRGARGAQVLACAASGDITGDKRPGTYTVGYLAAAVYG